MSDLVVTDMSEAAFSNLAIGGFAAALLTTAEGPIFDCNNQREDRKHRYIKQRNKDACTSNNGV